MAHTDQRTLGENNPYQRLRLDDSLAALHVAAHAHECRYDNGPQRNGTDEKPWQELWGITCWRGDPVSRTNRGNKKRRCKGNRCPRALGNDVFKKKNSPSQARMFGHGWDVAECWTACFLESQRTRSSLMGMTGAYLNIYTADGNCVHCVFPFWIWAAMI